MHRRLLVGFLILASACAPPSQPSPASTTSTTTIDELGPRLDPSRNLWMGCLERGPCQLRDPFAPLPSWIEFG